MTPSQREEAQHRLAELQSALNARGHERARTVSVAKLLMAYPVPGLREGAAEARGEAYRDALEDLPAWAVSEAVRRWNRGHCGEQNYSFAPAPAILRKITWEVTIPYRNAIEKIETALNAMTLDEAMGDGKQAGPVLKVVP